MLLRQCPAQSRQPFGPVLRPRISPASSELETLSPPRLLPSPRAPLSEMYPEESRGSGGVAAVDFLEGTYDYAAPTPAPTPLYSHSTAGYYSAPLDAHGPPSDGSLQSLGSGPTSPLVFVPSSPRLSPFMHAPSHHYLETTSTPVYSRSSHQPATREDPCGTRDDTCSVGEMGVGAGEFEVAKDTRFCAVCSDYASGYHYGVWSCEGCKAFFKRSIQGHNDYMCPATNQCTIDRNRRKSCQACRLRKCYEVGMMKGGVRKDRGRVLRRDKRRTGISVRDKVSKGLEHKPASHHDGRKHSGPVGGGGRSSATSMPPEQVLLLLQGAEPPILCSRQQLSRPYTEVTMMTLLTSMADKELVHMIAWAKKLPGFLQLSLHDQVLLLESSWLEVLMIGLIWRSIHCPGKLIFAQDLILDRNEGDCVEGMTEIFDMLLATASRFRMLKLKPEEFVCLKAIILLNSGAFSFCTGTMEPLHDSVAVQNMLDTITDALIHHISQSGYSAQQQARRQAQLLLLLSHIRHMSNKGMEHLYSMKCKNKVPLYDLLLEMLDAHRLHRPVKEGQSLSQADIGPPSTSSSFGGGPSRAPSAPSVLQYGGSRSDCKHPL
ncbi:estrogen receptor isoform X1 [Odontesthes bonariensis]|uniref:Estrogen receptor n=1 Tax=Odontesthes bonariensis TaxID=219752 RepID=A9YRP5_9TELE|nr:estrogen receptor alpha [Odontesthes bonariensis]